MRIEDPAKVLSTAEQAESAEDSLFRVAQREPPNSHSKDPDGEIHQEGVDCTSQPLRDLRALR